MVKHRRGGETDEPETLDLAIRLAGTPRKLGISWRTDGAEPGAVTLVRVQGGSPAQRAGLKVHDRIYEIGGQRFATSSEFLRLAKTYSLPFSIEVERDGRLREVTLEPTPNGDQGARMTP